MKPTGYKRTKVLSNGLTRAELRDYRAALTKTYPRRPGRRIPSAGAIVLLAWMAIAAVLLLGWAWASVALA